MRLPLLDHGYVLYVEHWGSDERIIESARMSTDKGFQGWGPKACECWPLYPHGGHPPDCKKCQGTGQVPGDEKLLRFLWEHCHFSPFEQAGLTIEVQAPIFVFREWHRHRTQSYNELSARYTPLPDLAYVPSLDRIMAGKQSTANKQGSQGGFSLEEAKELQSDIRGVYAIQRAQYEDFLRRGLARELARLVVPVAQYSRMRASANLRNWLAFLSLRLDEGAQWEIRQYAQAVSTLVSQYFPRTWSLAFGEGT